MPKHLVIGALPSRNVACSQNHSYGGHFVRRWLGRRAQSLLQPIKGILQLWVSLVTVHLPMEVGPCTHARVVPSFHTDSMVHGACIFYLLVVNGAVSDRRLHQCVSQAGPIDGAGFRYEGGILTAGNIGDLRHLSLQDLASGLH